MTNANAQIVVPKTEQNQSSPSAISSTHFFVPIIGFVTLLGLAFWLTPYDPTKADFLSRLQPPSPAHWFGTDQLGRDIATRILHGSVWSIGLAFIISTLGGIVGVIVGLVAGSSRNWFDHVMMRVTDSFFAFPELIAAIAISGILGPSTTNMVIALAMVSWMRYARLARSLTLDLSQADFVLQAHLNRLPLWRIYWRHYLPNMKLSILVLWTSLWSRSILSISALSFLGFGVQPPVAEWGAMLMDGKPYMQSAPHIMIFPGAAVLICVLCLNLIGDSLRDRLQKPAHQ